MMSNAHFLILFFIAVSIWPAVTAAQSGEKQCTVVILGSSTAEGTGASVPDNSWAGRYTAYISKNYNYRLINLARGGYTTCHILPDRSPLSAECGIDVDTLRNITHALTFDPDIIIINMPSNDAARHIPLDIQKENFKKIISLARQNDIQVWVCTSQPRNFSDKSQIDALREIRRFILEEYKGHTIEFWDGLAETNGFIPSAIDSGDGIHLNDQGHRILFERVLSAQIIDKACP